MFLELICEFCKIAEYKINAQKLITLLHNNEPEDTKIEHTIPLTINANNRN